MQSLINAFLTGLAVNAQIRGQAKRVFYEELNKKDREAVHTGAEDTFRNIRNKRGLYR